MVLPGRFSPSLLLRIVFLASLVALACFASSRLNAAQNLASQPTIRADFGSDACSGADCSAGAGLLTTGRDKAGNKVILLNSPPGSDAPSRPQSKLKSPVKDLVADVKNRMADRLKVPQEQKVWTKEELVLRSWEWRGGQVEPHESLRRVVAELNEYETSVRNWLLKTRPARLAGEGVGLGIRSTPNPALIFPDPDKVVLSWYAAGSHDKYEALKEEKERGVIAGSVSCADVSKTFSGYELQHRQTMLGHRGLHMIEAFIPSTERCGGIADRLLGIATTFLYALVTRRVLVINWQNTIPFDLLFDSPHGIDWSYPFVQQAEKEHPIYGRKENVENQERIYVMQWTRDKLDEFFSTTDWLNKPARWIRLLINRGLIIRSFKYPSIKRTLDNIGLEPQTAFSCMINYLLRPKPAALAMITEYSSVFAIPTIFSIGIQIRTGDESMKNARLDSINTVERHTSFFICAAQVAARYALPSQKVIYYVVSDSEALKADALAKFPDKVVVSGLKAKHTDPLLKLGVKKSDSKEKREREVMEGAWDSVVESWSLAETDFRIITEQSGFGKIASFLRGQPDRTITIFPEFDKDIQEGWRREPGRENLDCGLDSALVSFETLANQWSLG